MFDAALLRHFASHQNVGAMATFVVTFAVTAVIWNHVPKSYLLPWAAAQITVAVVSMGRLKRYWDIDDSAENTRTPLAQAIIYKAVAGALWGVLAIFSNLYLPQSLEFFTAIAVAAVAVGGISTMSAVPTAIYSFIILSFTPFIGFWLASSDGAYITLGLLGVLLLGVMLNSARVAHSQLLSVLKAEREHKRLFDEFEAARGDWLKLSDTTESYVVFDKENRLVAWNKRFVELMQVPEKVLRRGMPRVEVISHSRQAVDVAEGKVTFEQWLQQRTEPKNRNRDETSVIEFEGGLWIQRRSRLSKNGHLVVSHVDLTDAVNAEKALQETEAGYRSIAENSPIAIFVRIEDEIVFANPAAVTLLRAESAADIVGQSMLSLYHPGDHTAVKGNRTKLQREPNEPLPLVRARMRRVDGTYVMTDGSGTNHMWQGQAAVMSMRRDISDQVEADERLRESERRYRRIADLSPVAIVIRIEDRIVYANPAAIKMFGAESEADLLYESTLGLVHPDDLHLVENNRATMTDDMEGAAPSIKVRRRRFDGTYFYCEGSGAPFVWQGQPAVMLMWRDVTADAKAAHPMLETA
ncbi:MAG: PAS domain S-box protein [Alphaproteobacteria bacterium]|nr:PAS domain S-box protein [Alphaproteobacteria bacterium]